MTESQGKPQRMRRLLEEMAAGEDIQGMEIARGIRVLNRLYDLAVSRSAEFGELSGARLGILLRLLMEEECGNTAGVIAVPPWCASARQGASWFVPPRQRASLF